MSTLRRIRVTLTIPGGGDGLATFFSGAADTTAPAALLAFWTAVSAQMPAGLSGSVPNTGDTIDDATGTINGVWTASGGGSFVSSSGTGQFAAGTGARVRWVTGGIVHGHRVNGSTFICPIRGDKYDNDGTLGSGLLTALQTAVSDLQAATTLKIWSRPVGSGTPVPARAGSSFDVVAGFVPDKVTSLRTRRS